VGLLTRATILDALQALGDNLPARMPGQLVLAGGAALVVLYEARDSTKDVDAFLVDPDSGEALRRAARQVASDLGLPDDWLNDAVKGYIYGLALGEVVLESRNITVQALAPTQLLAMKLSAWRDDVDVEDARLIDDLWEASHGPA
jgi:hypothetical protein